jgi:hypothetical protein
MTMPHEANDSSIWTVDLGDMHWVSMEKIAQCREKNNKTAFSFVMCVGSFPFINKT